MDIFGKQWENHAEKIKTDWLNKVKEEDTVLIPGDFSWGMNLKEAYNDFVYLDSLPGIKIISKGNHDYWWNSLNKLENYIKENNFKNIKFLHNNSFEFEEKIITRNKRLGF